MLPLIKKINAQLNTIPNIALEASKTIRFKNDAEMLLVTRALEDLTINFYALFNK